MRYTQPMAHPMSETCVRCHPELAVGPLLDDSESRWTPLVIVAIIVASFAFWFAVAGVLLWIGR